MDEEFYPLAVLIDELKHDDVNLRLSAIRRLSTIATALGPERTRTQLIPFLDESVEDEDEVLTAIAEVLGDFIDCVGGLEHAHLLIKPLESLASIEEPLVREATVKSINGICEQLSTSQIEKYVVPLIFRLAGSDWFTTKISAAGLYATPYKKVSDSVQTQLRESFEALVRYESPMVRRAAARELPRFVSQLKPENADQIIAMFNLLAQDEQDSVRLLVVDVLTSMAEVIGADSDTALTSQLSKSLPALLDDKSWRVRCMVADRYEKIAKAVGGLNNSDLLALLVPGFTALAGDGEAEVRNAIAGQIPGFCAFIKTPKVIVDDILPRVEPLILDESQHVRSTLALHLSSLAPLLGEDESVKRLIPMFTHMLKDEFPDVRLNLISKLKIVTNVVGIQHFSESLLPAIRQLANDRQWRVRLAIIEYIPLLATQLDVKFFNEQLTESCRSWLGDTVYSIREAATQNLCKLTEVYGVEWAGENLVPRIKLMGVHTNYLYRMTTCFAYSALAPVLTLPVIKEFVIPSSNSLVDSPDGHLKDPTLKGLSEDAIPNIRFNVAKTYGRLIEILQKLPDEETTYHAAQAKGSIDQLSGCPAGLDLIATAIVPSLQKLLTDSDVDVRYFANEALQQVRTEGKAAGSPGDMVDVQNENDGIRAQGSSSAGLNRTPLHTHSNK